VENRKPMMVVMLKPAARDVLIIRLPLCLIGSHGSSQLSATIRAFSNAVDLRRRPA
jgi:hypothetical protein